MSSGEFDIGSVSADPTLDLARGTEESGKWLRLNDKSNTDVERTAQLTPYRKLLVPLFNALATREVIPRPIMERGRLAAILKRDFSPRPDQTNNPPMGPLPTTKLIPPNAAQVIEKELAINMRLALTEVHESDVCLEDDTVGPKKPFRKSRVVDDIATSDLVVTTSGLYTASGELAPVLIKRATFHQFLEGIRKEGWLEAASEEQLALSRRGTHILYTRETENGIPHLISNALFQKIDDKSLCMNPYFWEGWEAEVDRQEVIEIIRSYAHSQGEDLAHFTQRKKIDFDLIPATKGGLHALLVGVSSALEPDGMHELIRYLFDQSLMASGRRTDIFYDSMTATTSAIAERYPEIDFIEAIVEIPIIRRLRHISETTGLPCYQILSSKTLKGRKTYHALLCPKNIARGGLMTAENNRAKTLPHVAAQPD